MWRWFSSNETGFRQKPPVWRPLGPSVVRNLRATRKLKNGNHPHRRNREFPCTSIWGSGRSVLPLDVCGTTAEQFVTRSDCKRPSYALGLEHRPSRRHRQNRGISPTWTTGPRHRWSWRSISSCRGQPVCALRSRRRVAASLAHWHQGEPPDCLLAMNHSFVIIVTLIAIFLL